MWLGMSLNRRVLIWVRLCLTVIVVSVCVSSVMGCVDVCVEILPVGSRVVLLGELLY